MLVFAAVVFVSFLFLVSNGALTWGPAKRLVGRLPSRTSESTIARISGTRRIPGCPSGRPAGCPGGGRHPTRQHRTRPRPTGPGQAA